MGLGTYFAALLCQILPRASSCQLWVRKRPPAQGFLGFQEWPDPNESPNSMGLGPESPQF